MIFRQSDYDTYSYYSESELANILDLYENSPLMRRVVKILREYGEVSRFLKDRGIEMSEVADIISDREDEIDKLNDELNSLTVRITELESLPILGQLNRIKDEIESLQYENRSAKDINEALARQNVELKSKLSMWAKLNGNLDYQPK